MQTSRFLRVAAGVALALGFAAGAAHAQNADYPNRPVKTLVGFAAGGSTDVAARIVAQKMSEILGQSVLVENRTGASGLIAAEDVAKSPPDGYTLLMASQTVLAVAPRLYRKVTVDPVKDFAPVAYCGASPLVLVVNPAFPAHTTAEMIAMAKADPGKIIFGTGGVGTTPHIASEMFQHDAGIKMSHVPYRGEAGAINDLVAGQIPAMFANLSAIMGQLKAGTVRAIAVTSPQRSPLAPDVPTVSETLPGFAAETWFGLVAPAGTPHDVIVKLNAAALQALASDDTKKRYADLGMTNGGSSPEQLDAYIKSEIDKWSKVIDDAHIQPMD
ncbi:MAG TPA: tripartite tricarboxylate transporter substrate binding protein [Xanthobacteraceae bacterium]|nr:tripartite tricarboxylate transporter substrate binding protein [Xanthobacteraceae bacterium]